MSKYSRRVDSFLTITNALCRLFTAYSAIQVGLFVLFNVNAFPQPKAFPKEFAGLVTAHNEMVVVAWDLSGWMVAFGVIEGLLILGEKEQRKS